MRVRMEGRFFIRPLKQNRLTQVCLKSRHFGMFLSLVAVTTGKLPADHFSLFACQSQITGWCGPELLTEHRDKCTGRAIAGIERGVGYRLACSQALHRVDKPCPLSPSTERHSALLRE